MSNGWQSVTLGRILRKSEEWIDLEPDREYKEVTVKLWGKGAVLRGTRSGAEIAADRRLAVREGQLLLSRIDARNGALGVVPSSLDGAVVSNDFPAFNVDRSLALPEFLGWIIKTGRFVELCKAASEGTTNRVRLQEAKFLEMDVPLPPLDEQRRIVARIEELAAKIEEAQELRMAASAEIQAIWSSTLRWTFSTLGGDYQTLESICEDIIDNLHSTPAYDGTDYPCIRSQDVGWGRMDFANALRVSEAEFDERIRRGEPRYGDIVFVREGDIGRCAVVDGSQRFCLGQRVMMLRPGAYVDPHFLMYQLMSPQVLQNQILTMKAGTTSHHVNIKHLRVVPVLAPPLPVQNCIVARLTVRGGTSIFQAAHCVWSGTGRNRNLPAEGAG